MESAGQRAAHFSQTGRQASQQAPRAEYTAQVASPAAQGLDIWRAISQLEELISAIANSPRTPCTQGMNHHSVGHLFDLPLVWKEEQGLGTGCCMPTDRSPFRIAQRGIDWPRAPRLSGMSPRDNLEPERQRGVSYPRTTRWHTRHQGCSPNAYTSKPCARTVPDKQG